jgi:hypothetical protein
MARFFPLKACGQDGRAPACRQQLDSTGKAPEFCAESWRSRRKAPEPVMVARVSTAMHKKIDLKLPNIAAVISATSRNNIQEFSFWQEKNEKERKNRQKNAI